MGKSRKEKRYYQFPLCLLHMPRDGSQPALSDQAFLAQHIVSWGLIAYGRKRLGALQQRYGVEQAKKDVSIAFDVEAAKGEGGPNALPNDFDIDDWRHRAIFLANRDWFKLGLGGFRGSVARYERVRNYLEEYRELVGDGKDDMYARFRHDLLWKYIEPGRWSMRQIRVLAGFYAAIGGRDVWRISLNWLRYLTAGFKSSTAYECIQEHYGAGGPDLNALRLPDPPKRFSVEVTSLNGVPSSKADGYFRYDEALIYWRQHETDSPFTGKGGMFEVLLTNCGSVFKLRSRYLPEDGSAPTTGRFQTENVYEVGDQVVFASGTGKRRTLVLGEIEHAGYNWLAIRADGGRLYPKITRTEGRPAPARFFAHVLEQAGEKAGYGPDLLTQDKIRYTRDKLLDMGLIRSYYNGRHRYYSKNLDWKEIATKATNSKKHRLRRKVKEKRAKLEAQEEIAGLEAAVAAMEKEVEKQNSVETD